MIRKLAVAAVLTALAVPAFLMIVLSQSKAQTK